LHPRKFVRDALGATLSQYVARLMLLLRGLAGAAALGPFGYGGWNALNLVLDYGQYASLGALQGLELRLPAAAETGARERAKQLMAAAWGVVVAGATLFALALAAYLLTDLRAIEAPWGWSAPALMLAAALLQLAIQYHVTALRAHGDFHRPSAALAAQAVVGGGLGLALVFRFGVWALLGGWLAGGVVALLLLRSGPVPVPLAPARPGDGLALAALGFPIFAYFTATLVLRSLDRIAFVRYGTPDALGQYGLGLMAAGMVQYLPESVAAVLYPRIAAAAHGARDPERTRSEVARAHRAVVVALPLVVGIALPWAAAVTARLLPAFREGVPALKLLTIGALLLGAATVPSYWLLGTAGPRRHLGIAVPAIGLMALLVFATARRDPRPEPVAIAVAVGYAAFAGGLVALTSRALFDAPRERLRFVAASLVPALWAGGLVMLHDRLAPGDALGTAAAGTLAVAVLYLPVLWAFGRGIGLRQLAREWVAPRALAT
jgi:O-antigen/teichoic acid export membrane protein